MDRIVKICEYCGKEFEASKKIRQFCSVRCRQSARMKGPGKKICECCGKEYETRRRGQKYCGNECRFAAQYKKLKILECPICKKSFERKNTTQIYCSPKCGHEGRRVAPDKVCAHCGKAFHSRKYLQVYCSRKCGYEARTKRASLGGEDIAFLVKKYKIWSCARCAKRLGIGKTTLQNRIERYENEHGPIPFEYEKPPEPEIKDNSIATKQDIGEACMACNRIVHTLHSRIMNGRAGLMNCEIKTTFVF